MKETLQNERVYSTDKKRLVSLLVGAVLVSLSPLALILSTVPEMTPESWVSWVVAFLLVLWVSLAAGLALIVCPYVAARKWRVRSLLVCVVVATGVCIYPGGIQLFTGESEVVGWIEGVDYSKSKDGFRVNAHLKNTTEFRIRHYDVVRFQSSSGSSAKVKLIRSDVVHLLSVAEEAGQKQELKVIYLKQLKRLLKVNPANP